MSTDEQHDNFTVGEDVVLYVYRRHVRGKVAKVTPSRVTVSHGEGCTEVFHRRKYGRAFDCRRVTAEDLAREAWEAEVAVWKATRPVTVHLRLRQFYADGDYHVSMPREPAASLETLEQIAAEAHTIREWLRKRPEEPR